MTNNDEGALVPGQSLLELPHQNRREVVGRFVEQNDFVTPDQQAGEGQPAILTRREATHGNEKVGGAEQPQVEQAVRVFVQAPAQAGSEGGKQPHRRLPVLG